MEKSFEFFNKKSIFISLIIGKVILLPIIYFLFNFFDERTNALFLLPDIIKYEDSEKILNLFNFGSLVPNVGYMSLLYLVKKLTFIHSLKLFINSLISLIFISFSQTLILDLVFKENKFASNKLKFTALLLSISNFYILIYSFKPSSDVFGCFGISILMLALVRAQKINFNKNYTYFLNWTFIFLITCLFRNNLILILPFILFTKIKKILIKSIFSFDNKKRFFILLAITALLVINIFQFASAFLPYIYQQQHWGLITISNELNSLSSFSFIKDILIFISSKFIFLLSAREAVGMSGDWLINSQEDIIFTSNPIFTNILPSIILFIINMLGLISIFKFFSKEFRNSFLFSLIPLIPILSFAAHHRYFLPYSLITTASLPFLFQTNLFENK